MQTFELKGELRSDLGKKATKALRVNGNVPCVLYGGEGENIHFSLSEKQLNKILYTPSVYKLKIEIAGKSYDAVIRESQFHPVTDRTLHADFYQIQEDKPVTVEIPVKLNGFSVGVQAGGRLVLILRKVKVKALPANLPAQVDVDVTELGLGKSIKVKELSFDNYEITNAKDAVIVQVKMTRAAKAAEAAAQGK
ncbi:50S ribosomal protein L25/general stress protein Ctc [Porphyromonadaceae bacterium OttesenSCG-928-L07]|nr:50S ribosomal protein L25/general stress protein Ctc [Porphyromonadaceae bacterium OttesenSCG-928-L07]MDL2252085.1 50S ribosomal protein L25/general stress protein Ctc [Odoribacter sp. OttesenSCG-928-J03]MDL2330832.1 50S ribosomal protein L25/general stress protein Ctc [Odoribacter sp. OttesenSCG-928-A06]